MLHVAKMENFPFEVCQPEHKPSIALTNSQHANKSVKFTCNKRRVNTKDAKIVNNYNVNH